MKGLSKFTKKSELHSEIERINEQIDLLKVGLFGIAKRYGYQTEQDFCRAYYTAKNAYTDYQDKVSEWEETYRKNMQTPKNENLHKRLQNYQKGKAEFQVQHLAKIRTEGRDKSPSNLQPIHGYSVIKAYIVVLLYFCAASFSNFK